MPTLALQLVLTPLLVGTASLAGRRWGPAISGWLVGLPFTSGPIALFVALDQGLPFATRVAEGTLAGGASQAAFALAYAHAAGRVRWPGSLGAATAAFAASTAALRALPEPLPPAVLFAGVVGVLVLTLALLPRPAGGAGRPEEPAAPPAWDVPARMAAATAFVLVLSGLAPALGAGLTGLLAPFPLYGAVLAVFAHRNQGRAAALGVLRGLVLGLFAFCSFFLVLAVTLDGQGLLGGFAAATAAGLAVQALALARLRGHARGR